MTHAKPQRAKKKRAVAVGIRHLVGRKLEISFAG